MKVLIYGLNNAPELTGIGKYTGELCQYLATAEDTEVIAVSAQPYYPEWSISKGFRNTYSRDRQGNLLTIRCPLYVPNEPGKISRLIHLTSFALSSAPVMLSMLIWRPDRVIVIAPTLFCTPLGILVAKLTRATSYLHIQDYEVEAMFSIIGDKQPSRLARFAYWVEKKVLGSFDYVSTISRSMVQKAIEKGVDEKNTILFPNWVDADNFTPSPRNDESLRSLGLNPDHFVVVYSGNIGEKQGLELAIEAASKLRDISDISFLIAGEGVAKRRLVELAKQHQLESVVFSGLLPIESFRDLLCSADLHLVIQKKGVADLVLPSKLTTILSVGGNAVVSTESGSELALIVEEHPGIYQCIESEDLDALVEAIRGSYLAKTKHRNTGNDETTAHNDQAEGTTNEGTTNNDYAEGTANSEQAEGTTNNDSADASTNNAHTEGTTNNECRTEGSLSDFRDGDTQTKINKVAREYAVNQLSTNSVLSSFLARLRNEDR